MKLQSFQRTLVLLFATTTGSLVSAQSYNHQDYGDNQQDYYGQEEDNLYHDYAQHQQVKAQGGGGGGYVLFGPSSHILAECWVCSLRIYALNECAHMCVWVAPPET